MQTRGVAIHIVLVMGLAGAVLAGAGPPPGAVQQRGGGAPSAPSAAWFHALQRLLLYRQHMGHCDVEVRVACGTRLCVPASMRDVVMSDGSRRRTVHRRPIVRSTRCCEGSNAPTSSSSRSVLTHTRCEEPTGWVHWGEQERGGGEGRGDHLHPAVGQKKHLHNNTMSWAGGSASRA